MIEYIKFSVGIPAYKGRYLFDCIESVLNQTYPLFELIIVNDFSPDPLDTIVGQFSDDRIRYFKNTKNTGAEHLANNYNRCLEKANGEFFVLMGDDDKMESDYLQEFAKLISKYPNLDIYHCRSKIIDGNSNAIMYTPSWPEYESVYDNIWHRMNGYRILFIADYMYRLPALKNNGGFYYMPLGWYTDDITSYIAMREKGIAHTNKPVLNYRQHAVNISSSGNDELKMKAVMRQELWFADFLKDKPKITEDFIIYENLCRTIRRLMQKHKFEIISSSLNTNFFERSISWVRKRKEYGISMSEIFYSTFQFFKNKRGARRSKLSAQKITIS